MPSIDSHVFSFALSTFLFFGSANLTVELMISFIVLCKKLKATFQSRYSLESGKLESPGSLHRDNFPGMSASLLTQVMSLSASDRQTIRSILEMSLRNESLTGAQEESLNQDSTSGHDEDLGWLRISGGKSNSNLTH
jgi:hypothetical protein